MSLEDHATALVASVVVILALRWLAAYRRNPPARSELPDNPKRAEYFQKLQPLSSLENEETALFLLAEVKDTYDRKIEGSKSLDAKASSLLALVAGGTGAYTLLGGIKHGTAVLDPLPALSLALFLGTLVTCLYALRVQRRSIPSVAAFNSVPVLKDPANKARVAFILIDRWQANSIALDRQVQLKGIAVYWAALLLVFGVIALVLNFVLPAAPPGRGSVATHAQYSSHHAKKTSGIVMRRSLK